MEAAAGGHGAARKRRPPAAARALEAAETAPQLPLVPRKKPRRRDNTQSRQSEFVSVEVGMRELRKRLAVTDSATERRRPARSAPAAPSETDKVSPPPVAAVTQRGRPATTRAKATVASAAKSTAGSATRAKRAAPRKDPPKKVAASGKKPTLAEAREQARLEQQARVATRVQQLKDGKAAGTHVEAASSVLDSTAASTTDSVTALAAPTTSAVAIAAAPLHSATDKQAQPEAIPGASSSASDSQAAVRGSVTPPKQPATMQRVPSEPVIANEFIGDDVDEDLIFLMALEEVEKKLATPNKPAVSAATAVHDAASVDAHTIKQESEQATAPSVAQEASSQPHEPMQPEPLAPSIMSPDDVLREFERLKRENEDLRKSNERLQAVALARASPSLGGSVPATTPPGGTDSSPQARRALDLDGDGVRDQGDLDAQEQTTLVANSQPGLDQAHSTTSSPRQRQRESQSPGTPVETGAILACDATGASILDLSPAPRLTPQTRTAQTPTTPTTESRTDELSSTEDREVDARERTPLKRHGNESDAAPSSPPASTHTDDVHDEKHEQSHSEEEAIEENEDEEEDDEEEEEDHHDTRTVTVDCGNYHEYMQEQYNEEDASDGPDEAIDDAELTELRNPPSTEAVEPPKPPQQDREAYPDGEPPSIDLVGDEDEDEDAVTSLPSEPVSSVELDEEDESFVSAKRTSRPAVIESSSSSDSDASSDSEPEDMDVSGDANGSSGAKNALEAALQAAASATGAKKRFAPRAPVARHPAVAPASIAATSIDASKAKPNQNRPAPTTSATTSGAPQTVAKKRARSDSTSLASNATASSKRKGPASNAATVRSTLLWPALDDFYDFLLDLSPGHVGGGGGQRQDWSSSPSSSSSLRQFAGRKLPTRYESVEQYCTTQMDAITEELLASIGNNRGGGGGHSKAFYLTSVSQCNPNLNANAQIFSESGFTGAARNANDYIMTFRALPRQRGQGDGAKRSNASSLDLMSGDLISLRSPQWKSFELFVYGVVLCNSIVGDASGGGSNGSGGSMGTDGSDQVCVLVRVQTDKRVAGEGGDDDALLANFSVVTELCLSNQRAAKWSWAIQHVHNTTTSAREYQAIRSMAFFSPELQKTLLNGVLPLKNGDGEGEDDRAEDVLSPELKKRLERQYNAPQMRAIVGCLGEDKTVMIQGPPGTGKTKTVLGLLSALLDGAGLASLSKGTARIRVGASLQGGSSKASGPGPRNNSVRVLVAAPSNAAVDELVVRVVSEGLVDGSTGQSYRPRMVRVGRPESVGVGNSEREASSAKKTRGKMRKYAAEVEDILLETQVARQKASFGTARAARQAIVRGAQVVFCTLSGAGSVALCDFAHEFDALIIDEAAQAVEASALIPLKFRPHRTILVGDHRQLPATVLSKRLVAIGYDRSLFQRLVENGSRVRLLTRQYRMHPDIARFPSAHFYGGKLVQDAQLSRSTARPFHSREPFCPLAFIDVAGGTQSQVSGSTSLRNLSEVELVVLLVRTLVHQFPDLEWRKTIGVIAPYKQQIFELGARLAQLEREMDVRLGIEVNTVDGFQGREKDIIIYSCVRTSAGGRRRGKKQRSGRGSADASADAFWADERRMNVAITRARASLWILGNSRLLEQSAAWRALIKDARGRRAYFSDDRAKQLLLPSDKAT